MTAPLRPDGRSPEEPRPLKITPGYLLYAEGSALVEMGNTRVLCAVSVEDRVPAFLRGTGKGWVTAEYAMLPRSTLSRTPREAERGRNQEIQRFIGRALRAVTDLSLLGERTFLVDCDVLQADGGTRTAAVTGGYVALHQAFLNLVRRGLLPEVPLRCAVAAISIGRVEGALLLDLCYEEDSRAEVDCTVALTEKGEVVEVHAAAEGKPFPQEEIESFLALARKGLSLHFSVQREALRQVEGASPL